MVTYEVGREAPIGHAPQRVVSLVPSVTESLFELGVGDRLVGITDYCVYPAQEVAHLPRIGGTKNPDIAKIIALQPDLVIVNQEENSKEDAEAITAAGIAVWVTYPRTVREAFNLLWAIMDLFDEASMVERVRAMEWSCDWLDRIEHDPPCKVFAPIWYEPLMTFNGDTYAHDLLRICGGENVFAERERQFPLKADLGEADPLDPDDPRIDGRDRRYPRITFAEIEAAQPDVILLPSEPFEFNESHIEIFAVLDVPAAHNNRIHLVDGSLLTWHGTRVGRALNLIPSLLCDESS